MSKSAKTVDEVLKPVRLEGGKDYILVADKEALLAALVAEMPEKRAIDFDDPTLSRIPTWVQIKSQGYDEGIDACTEAITRFFGEDGENLPTNNP